MKIRWLFAVWICVALLTIGCAGDTGDDDAAADDAPSDGDGPGDGGEPEVGDEPGDPLGDLMDQMGFEEYLAFRPVRTEPGANGYTNYYYSTDDLRCFTGKEMHVAVSPGTANKVMVFLEGGGAKYPGGGFQVQLDLPMDMSFKSRDPDNPLADWTFVYVPYCDASIHSGDNQLEYDGHMRYHHGLRQIAAAAALTKELFPDPEKVLVAGSSAGGMGTYYAWPVVKSQYRETDTYILNDSGVGFWNPSTPDTFQTIIDAWDLRLPDQCVKCGGTIQTYVYDMFLEFDPQLRIGMFTSYRDGLISRVFLDMNQGAFEQTLMVVTDEIHADYPDRFARFFVLGQTHTSYEFIFPGGPHYEVDGISMYAWIDGLVNDDPAWPDLLE